jgi:hypothetical protein
MIFSETSSTGAPPFFPGISAYVRVSDQMPAM